MSIVWKGLKIIGLIIRICFWIVVFGVIAFLIMRVTSANAPENMESLDINDKIYEAYDNAEGELYMFRQEQRSVTSGEENYGYFSVTKNLFIPKANQVQTVLRYNNSTIRALAEDYSLDEVPERSEELFDVSLLIAIDLTPDDEEDNLSNDSESVRFVRIHPGSVIEEEKNIYNFRKFIFDLDSAGIDIAELIEEELLLAVYVDVYYVGDLDYEKTPYGTLCVYDYITEDIEVKLTKDEKSAIEKYRD